MCMSFIVLIFSEAVQAMAVDVEVLLILHLAEKIRLLIVAMGTIITKTVEKTLIEGHQEIAENNSENNSILK